MTQLNLAEKKLPDFELGLHTYLENMDFFAGQAINGLKQANEARFLQRLVRQCVSIAPIDTDNLLIAGDETVKWLRAVNEQKLFQKLVKTGSPLEVPDLEEFTLLSSVAQHNLAGTHDIKIVADLSKISSILCVPELGSFTQEAKQISHSLHMAASFKQLEQLKRIPVSFKIPELQILELESMNACASLKKINDFLVMYMVNRHKELLVLPNIARFATRARFTTKRLQCAHETRIMTKIFKSEINRRKIIKNCYCHAEWAGSDLQRWDRVFREYEKNPKKLKILNGLIEEAHSKFLMIMVDSANMGEIEKKCTGKPFLLREFKILQNEVEKYYQEEKSTEEKENFSTSPYHLRP